MSKKGSFWFFLVFAVHLPSVFGFALLGPFAPWMTEQLTYQDGGQSIGGPMNIGEGYRWNVPVVTYGFDQSFVNYFGTNGVAAVQSAIQILNDLPPASTGNPSNYFLISLLPNNLAERENLLDLKSFALALTLEHLGLAQPTRFMFTLRNYSSPTNYSVIMRNFDPFTLQPSDTINGTEYFYGVNAAPPPSSQVGTVAYPVDPQQSTYDTIADGAVQYLSSIYSGNCVTFGLTQDDVGGLFYLLSTNNLALENVLPGVTGVGSNANAYVNTAIRPGVDKIAFLQQAYDSASGQFVPITNQYIDSFVSNGVIAQQTLQRVIAQPDFLFTARDVESQFQSDRFLYSSTGTSNWINNGAPLNDGPGVIQPPVVIAFDVLGQSLKHYGGTDYANAGSFTSPIYGYWGSFDRTATEPIAYPVPSLTNSTIFRFTLWPKGYLSWALHGPTNGIFLFQTTTDFSNWTTITNITNSGGTFSFSDMTNNNSPNRFYRTIPQ